MAEVIETEARVIDPEELVKLPEAFKWLSEAEKQVSDTLADGLYSKPVIKSYDDYRLAKQHRTQIRAAMKEIDDQKKSYTQVIKKAIRDFETRTNNITEPLKRLEAEYKDSISAYDEIVALEKRNRLEAYFFDLVPALVGVIDFTQVEERFDSKGQWKKKSYNEVSAQKDLDKAAKAIESEYLSIDAMGLDDKTKQEVRADYFGALDLNVALTKHKERQERQARIAAIEAERKAAEERAAREAAEREAQSSSSAQEQAQEQPQAEQPVQEEPKELQEQAYTLYIKSGKADDWMLAISTILMLGGSLSINTQLNKQDLKHLVKVLKDNNIRGNLRSF